MSPRAPLPENEQERIAALHNLNILDTPPEERFERIVRLAKQAFQVPIVTISLIDTHRQWFKAYCGPVERETPREEAFCAYMLLDGAPLIVPNALEDERFSDNPSVLGKPFIRFYAGYPLHDPGGYILGTVCLIDQAPRHLQSEELELLHDIAQLVEHEIHTTTTQKVLLSHWKDGQRFYDIFNYAALGMVLLDKQGNIVECNEIFAELTGFKKDDLNGLSISTVVDVQHHVHLNTLLVSLFSGDISYKHIEHQYRRRDGTTFDFFTTFSTFYDTFSKQDLCVATTKDMTAHKNAEREARQAQQVQAKLATALHVVLESIHAAVVFFAIDQRVRILNHCFTEFFGLTPEQLQQLSVDQIRAFILPLFAPESIPPELFQRDLTNISNAEMFTQTLVQTTPVYRELNLQAYPVYLPSNEYLGRLYIYTDVTKEREVERFKNEFVSLVSHELRTPLTSIKGFAGLMMEEESGTLNEEQHEYLSIIQENSERLIALVNDLLDVSRIESGKVEIQRKPVNIEQVCRNLAKSFEPLILAKKQHLTVEFLEPVPLVIADENRLQQILNNLLSNASKYTLEGGSIRLWARKEGYMLRIGIQDTGVGMSEEEQKGLFTKFYRIKNYMTENISGTGLGLTITRSLVELQGGKISVESTKGVGSTFSFTLPLVVDQPRRKTPTATVHIGKKHILVVDDEPNIAHFLRRSLERHGYRVTVAKTGNEALELTQSIQPNLILLDLLLPDIPGLTVLNQLKADDTTRGIPVILVSILDTNIHAQELGAVAVLVKPFQEPILLAQVENILQTIGTKI